MSPQSSQRTQRLNRLLPKVLICLLLGLALNFGVAYACAKWSPILVPIGALAEQSHPLWLSPQDLPRIDAGHGTGVRRWREVQYPDLHWDTRLGWPLMSVNVHDNQSDVYPISGIPWVGSVIPETRVGSPYLDLAAWSPRDTRTWSLLPLGTTINTLFYAAILFALWITPGILIRWNRARRGLCRRCAYDITGVSICPECGTATPLGTSPS